jgi:hypothetical protein
MKETKNLTKKVVDAGPDIELGSAFARAFAMLPPDRKAYWAEKIVSGSGPEQHAPNSPTPSQPARTPRSRKVV